MQMVISCLYENVLFFLTELSDIILTIMFISENTVGFYNDYGVSFLLINFLYMCCKSEKENTVKLYIDNSQLERNLFLHFCEINLLSNFI